ncbi:MAG TPA: HepT-like ribonuclease domain-containing protein [Tepidisphaeraceae bacterium]|jgi:uncharacterized protein with HEPN domain
MLEAARDAVAIAAGRKREEMESDILLRHALIHCVEVIGEATARVGDAGRTRVPELPWPRIVGMRHILVNDYFRVDHDAVWRVVAEHIPQMIPLLESALANWPATELQ